MAALFRSSRVVYRNGKFSTCSLLQESKLACVSQFPQTHTWCKVKHTKEEKVKSLPITKTFGMRSSMFSTAATPLYNEDTDNTNDYAIVQRIQDTLTSPNLGRLFAVVMINNTQYKITTEDIIVVQGEFKANIGDRIRLEKVMLVGGKDFSLIGTPLLERNSVCIEATVIEKKLDTPRIHFRMIKRSRIRKLKVLQDQQALLRINSIEVASR